MPGLNYRLGRLPLFPLRVFYSGLSARQNMLEVGIIAQKETQQKSRAGTRIILKQRRGHSLRDSEVTVTVGFGECQDFC